MFPLKGETLLPKKKIHILNNIPAQSTYKEEVLGMQPEVLRGDITKIR